MKIILSVLVFISICFGDAQVNLGLMYENGQGVKQDYKKAKDLYKKACDGQLQVGCDYYKELNQEGH